MKKMVLCLSLSTTTSAFVACTITDKSHNNLPQTNFRNYKQLALPTFSYSDINQTTDIKAIIQSVETYAKKKKNYGDIPYHKEKLLEALNEKFINTPTLPENLPHVVAILITKKGGKICQKLENVIVPALLDATEKINTSLGASTQQNIHIALQDGEVLPQWLASFITESGYSLADVTTPCLMYMTYLKKRTTAMSRWIRLDDSNPSLKEPITAVTRANLVYDTYLELLPERYQLAFSANQL